MERNVICLIRAVREAVLAGWSSPGRPPGPLCRDLTPDSGGPGRSSRHIQGPSLTQGGKKVHEGPHLMESTWEGLDFSLDVVFQWQAARRRQYSEEAAISQGAGNSPWKLLQGQNS